MNLATLMSQSNCYEVLIEYPRTHLAVGPVQVFLVEREFGRLDSLALKEERISAQAMNGKWEMDNECASP